MKSKLLLISIMGVALAIGLAPLPQRCRIRATVGDEYSEDSQTKQEAIDKLMDSIRRDSNVGMNRIVLTSTVVISAENSTAHQAEQEAQVALLKLKKSSPWPVREIDTEGEVFFPWERSVLLASLGVLTLFGILMRFGRRESL